VTRAGLPITASFSQLTKPGHILPERPLKKCKSFEPSALNDVLDIGGYLKRIIPVGIKQSFGFKD